MPTVTKKKNFQSTLVRKMVTVRGKLRNRLIIQDIKTLYALDKAKPAFKYSYRGCAWGRGQVFNLK